MLTTTAAGEKLQNFAYQYDLNGNRLNKVGINQETHFAYDSMNRLTKAKYNEREESFTYDLVGNRLSHTVNGDTSNFIYNTKNQLKELRKDLGIINFTYDLQGNILKESSPQGETTFNYNALNQQTKVTAATGNTLVNRYDAENLRAEIEENEKLTRFIFHRDEILVETNEEDIPISRFIRGYDVVASDISVASQLDAIADSKSPSRYYYQLDEQFSTSFITNSNGQVENKYTYDAFGNTLENEEDVHNRIKYAGQQYDPVTEQYYLRARFYNPILGRFMQEDVYRGDGLNLYAYCDNNPAMYYDPSGYQRKNLEPRQRIEEVRINEDGSREYLLKYKDKYQNEAGNRTFNITYTNDLDPVFTEYPEYIYNNGGDGSVVILESGFNGRNNDFNQADTIIREKFEIQNRPEGYTWHHERDGQTMRLVRTDVHDSTTHTGGDSYSRNNASDDVNDTGKCT